MSQGNKLTRRDTLSASNTCLGEWPCCFNIFKILKPVKGREKNLQEF